MTATIFYNEELNNMPYEKFIQKKNEKPYKNYRYNAKTANFAIIYGAQVYTVAKALNLPMNRVEQSFNEFLNRYSGLKEFRNKMEAEFVTADTRTWVNVISEMKEYIEDLWGNKRFFIFEKELADLFWQLSKSYEIHTDYNDCKIIRRKQKGEQSYQGAVQSAFLGASIGIQKKVLSKAINTPVQSTGGWLTKRLMAKIWEEFRAPILNVHDELNTPKEYNFLYNKINSFVQNEINEIRDVIPNLNMEWKKINNWSEK